MLVSGLLRLALASLAGGAVVVSPIVFSSTFKGNKPLTVEKLEKFKKSEGFDSCYPFLQEENKLSLLFACLKKKGTNIQENKTHIAYYFFYNGGSWEEAISLRKNPYSDNSLLVKTRAGWWDKERSIKNTEEQSSNLSNFGLNKECQFKHTEMKGSHLGKRFFECSVGDSKLRWNLKEFK